jgi:hypothetical protein
MRYINLVTLPRNCFSAVPLDYPCNSDTLKIEKFAVTSDNFALKFKEEVVNDVVELINNKEESFYVNLDVRKYLMVDAQLKSGKVQGLTCNYYIHTYQDNEQICVMQVKELLNDLQVDNYIHDHENYTMAKNALENAIDFDLIDENDYVRMTYTNPIRHSWKDNTSHWHVAQNHRRLNVQTLEGMVYPSNKKIIPLEDVLPYCNNNVITEEQSNKIKKLLEAADTEKMALTIMNSINPAKSFIEMLCTINYMHPHLKRNNPNVPVLPLLYGAYKVDTTMIRRSDAIIKIYTEKFGEPDNETLEKLTDSYWHPKNEKSSIFDFKLKLRKR